MKGILVTIGLAAAGYWLSERFVIKQDESDTTGFILASPGFGLDELARATTIGLTVHFGRKLLSKWI